MSDPARPKRERPKVPHIAHEPPAKPPLHEPGDPGVHPFHPQPEITPNRSQPEVVLPPRHSTKN
jgi:hypothetical protein